MDTASVWKMISSHTQYPSLKQDLDVDVAIIGGGITGITAALQLTQAGKKVAVLEASDIGGITTGSSTGNLYIAVQPYYQNIVKKFDLATARHIAHSRQFAIDYIEKNIQENAIHCNFSRRPWYAYTNDEEKLGFLAEEIETFKQMEIPVSDAGSMPLPFQFKKAVVMENQARFNPLQYVIGMAAYLSKRGCEIFENTRIKDIVEKKECTLITTLGHKIKAKNVIMATHTPPGVNVTQLFTAPYRSYVVAVHLKDHPYPEGHFWDLDDPHHATCTHSISDGNQPELLMVAGSHHKVGQGNSMITHYHELEAFLRSHLPVENIAYRWSAQHYQSADDVPYIGLAGRFAKHTYLATGFFADGLLYGTLAGIIISDAILEKNNKWKDIYRSTRFTPIASCCFLVKENMNYFMQYYNDFPKSETTNFDDLKTGEARIVEIEGEKWAVYRDKNDKLQIVSAVCTHMKCLVNWNDAEKTWDCPCHGSRFTTEGKVIEGPAKIDLKRKDL